MTIDERLEAITHSLDTLTKIHLDNDREYHDRFAEIAEAQHRNLEDNREFRERFREIAEAQRRNDEHFAQIARQFEVVKHTFESALDSIKRLENVAVAHEQRLDDLENR